MKRASNNKYIMPMKAQLCYSTEFFFLNPEGMSCPVFYSPTPHGGDRALIERDSQ